MRLLLFFLVLLVLLFTFLYPIPYTLYPLSAHSTTQVIKMTPSGFDPQEVTVDTSSSVIFVNEDKVPRWPASNIHPTHEIYPEFDSQKPIDPGQSWSFKPKKAGTFKFHDHLLPHFRGTLIVTSEAGSEVTTESSKPNFLVEIKNRLTVILSEAKDLIISFTRFGRVQDDQVNFNSLTNLSSDEQFKAIEEMAKKSGVEPTWKAFSDQFRSQGGSSGNIHDLAHLIGGLIYKDKGFGGITICSAEFAFGCYHGFLDTAFKNSLDDLTKAEEACGKLGSGGPFASCIHGIGHGVASFYTTSDLRASLKSCLKLEPRGREYCYDGVFMEFARSAPVTFYKKDDPYYPCSDLEKNFGPVYPFSCGRNQPSVLMSKFNIGFDEVADICLKAASTPFKQACFDSLGFSLAGSADVNQIIAGCQRISDPEYAGRCAKAAAGELIFQEAPDWQNKSEAVCAHLPGDTSDVSSGFASGLHIGSGRNGGGQREDCFAHLDQLVKDYGRVKKITFAPLKEGEDPNAYVRSVLKICYGLSGAGGCYKQAADVLYDQLGLSKTLGLFKANENYPEVYARCHEVTHYLSRAEYQKQGSIAKVYSQCDSTCHGGCYHGVLEAYLREQEGKAGYNLAFSFAAVCGEQKDYKSPLEFNECLHGMGHAAMFVTEMELKESLKLCDSFSDQQSKERCYTGVFMENSSSSTGSDHASIYIKKDDPFYPCNSLEEKYQALCWQYQSSYFSIISHQDFVKVANLCLQIPEQYQDRCFRTIGTNQVGFTRSMGVMKSNCSKMPTPNFRSICVGGVISSLSYRFVGEAERMVEFCTVVDADAKESCYRQMGTALLDWSTDKNLAKQNCSKIRDPQGLSWCMSVI